MLRSTGAQIIDGVELRLEKDNRQANNLPPKVRDVRPTRCQMDLKNKATMAKREIYF